MQFFPAPADHSARSSVRSPPYTVEEPPLGFHGIRVPIDDPAYRVGYQASHRLVPGGGVDSKAPEQGLWQAERDVLVVRFVHVMCAPRVPTYKEYSDWLAIMNRRFLLLPPKQMLAQVSGSTIMPMRSPAGVNTWTPS
jgi:hypothetical protein